LYHKANLDVPTLPYIFEKGDPLREIVKRLINTAINAKSGYGAIESVKNKLISRKPDLVEALMKSKYFDGDSFDRDSSDSFEKEIRKALKKLYSQIMEHHGPVKSFFGSSRGAGLQRQDSDIASAILWHFTQKGIPVIPIHDSFIVAENNAAELRQVMKDMY
jgi:hypothetical protein